MLEGVKPEPGFFRVISSRHQLVALTPLTLTIFTLWAALVALGARAALAGAVSRPAALLVAGGLGFFFVLHMVYGVETFLFALLFAPLMTIIALWGTATRLRWLVRGLCVALCAASLAYNYPAFQAAVEVHNAIHPSWLEGLGAVSDATAQMACE